MLVYDCKSIHKCISVSVVLSMWQSPPLCSDLLSHLGQSLKVSPINGKEQPGLTDCHTPSDMKAGLYVKAESYQFVGSNDL